MASFIGSNTQLSVCQPLDLTGLAKTDIDLDPKTTFHTAGEHLIASFVGQNDGPTLIVVGGLHGNEPAGIKAMHRIADKLRQMHRPLSGRLFLLAGNTSALARFDRYIDIDLNRCWTAANLGSTGSDGIMKLSEGREMTELGEILDHILITAKDEVYVVDLHSTSADGSPFATIGDTLRNREFALGLPVTVLLGIEEQLDGTLLEYLNNAGAVTLGFEGGSHSAPSTVDNHESLVWLALVNAGLLDPSDIGRFSEHEDRLVNRWGNRRILEVRYREAIRQYDHFEMNRGFKNFDRVTRGQVLAKNKYGPIRAIESGLLLMPLYQRLGQDGFFIGRSISPFWLALSKLLRKMQIQEIIHLLPGVHRDAIDPETLIVNTRLARFFPLQIFHLLGFRRRRWKDGQLIVSRRKHDTRSPFKNSGVSVNGR